MSLTDLTDQEIHTLIVALKYWRSNRRNTRMRRGDRAVSSEVLDLLLAKLETATISSLPADALSNHLHQPEV